MNNTFFKAKLGHGWQHPFKDSLFNFELIICGVLFDFSFVIEMLYVA